ncbi:FecR domain-containing protein [Chitinophaga pinensis]|uniref:Anti-FecI sigma factor, FecR n=1 Tax=Chitinophaga pinensis (strain ATCC 43595 / DSM 2588 / LMG 13176 / NBRC 15968 / NCIMB 11800 / UQM 2034) TaxID=485918 RepID=A0A979G6Y5_CHIPD|nr:FecR domain-containing protein [Chitinophaga pinensis]ACU62049.1 anti-FecI sigma factor, FecR [Chitinophaga pinensis DSM 2588]
MTEKEVAELLRKYRSGECSPEELAFMERWYADLEQNAPDLTYPHSAEAHEKVWQEALARHALMHPKKNTAYIWAAAATITILLATGILYFNTGRSGHSPQSSEELYAYNKVHDRLPGSSKAVLTLANGEEILLNDSTKGTIAQQSGMIITKNAKGQLTYTIDNHAPAANSTGTDGKSYNTIRTPNGGQYQVYLPDGSLVILNAASSLRYPVTFNSNNRSVELSGEAYFEITQDVRRPFLVVSSTQTVKVLGTHFNISCYPDENIKTTLAEGSILLTGPHLPSKTLKPGQQAIQTASGLQVVTIDADEASAWKDGLFIFRKTPVKTVLRQLCRWYDMETADIALPDITFDGEIPKDQPLSELLNVIAENSHVKFKIAGKKIIRQ